MGTPVAADRISEGSNVLGAAVANHLSCGCGRGRTLKRYGRGWRVDSRLDMEKRNRFFGNVGNEAKVAA